MFRIDRSLVKVSRHKIKNFVTEDEDEDEDEDEEIIEDERDDPAVIAEAMLNEYISAAEKEMQEKAKALVDDARVEAAQLLLNARSEIDEERKQGWTEGYQEGVEEGKRTYDEKIKEKIEADDRVLKNVLDELYSEHERIKGETESETIRLALEIVKKIIGPAEDELGTVFTSLVKNTLRQMSSDGKMVIRVGPEEFERFFPSGAATIELDSGITVSATVMKDLSLGDGDLIIDSDEGTVNAGIDSQLEYVKIAFERANQYEPD